MCTYIISVKLGLVSSTKVKRLFDLVVYEIYFPQQLGFDVFAPATISAEFISEDPTCN